MEQTFDMQLVVDELARLNENVTLLNATVELILIEVEIIAMSIIAIWLLQWIRRVCRKRRVSDNG